MSRVSALVLRPTDRQGLRLSFMEEEREGPCFDLGTRTMWNYQHSDAGPLKPFFFKKEQLHIIRKT